MANLNLSTRNSIQSLEPVSRTKWLDLENVLSRSSEKSSVDMAAFFKERSCVDLSCELKC